MRNNVLCPWNVSSCLLLQQNLTYCDGYNPFILRVLTFCLWCKFQIIFPFCHLCFYLAYEIFCLIKLLFLNLYKCSQIHQSLRLLLLGFEFWLGKFFLLSDHSEIWLCLCLVLSWFYTFRSLIYLVWKLTFIWLFSCLQTTY